MKKTKRINYWLDDKYLAKLERQAEEANLARSEYIRKLIRDADIIPAPDIDYIAYSDEFQRLERLFNEYIEEYQATGTLDREGSETVWEEICKTGEKLRNELIDKTTGLRVIIVNGKK